MLGGEWGGSLKTTDSVIAPLCPADLHGTAIQHRELQGNESDTFLAVFPRITILHGGVATGFRHVEEDTPIEKLLLYRVTKAVSRNSATPSGKTSTLVQQVEPTWTSLVEDDCFILDRGTKVMIWQGKKASPYVTRLSKVSLDPI